MSILSKAGGAVEANRAQYGNPSANFGRIARYMTVHLKNHYDVDVQISEHTVGVMMMLVKIARLEQDMTHEDSKVDIAGYAECLSQIDVASVAKMADKIMSEF